MIILNYQQGVNMKVSNKLIALIIFSTLLIGQTEPIFFGQQKAIQSLAAQSGFTAEDLNKYIEQQYGRALHELTQTQGAALITDFQNGAISINDIQPKFVSNPQLSEAERKKLLTAASVLEEGMKKRFHFRDGSINEGEILNVEGDLVELKTGSGVFKIPRNEFLAETAEITNKSGERFVGNVLADTAEEFRIRTQYGDATIHKRDIEKMRRYHGGVLDQKTEERKRFYVGEASLLTVFLDPTANILSPNTFYISGMSLGYGLTDRFQMTTKYASNFNGDLNLHPRLRLFHRKTATNERNMSIGLGFHRAMPIKSIIGRYSHAIEVDGTVNPKTKEAYRLNELKSNNEKYVEKAASVVDGNADDPIYVEAYAVFTSHRINPTGRGKVGWSIGGKISNAFVDRDKFLVSGYTWDEDYKIPYRLWASFDYDLRKDLKFVASTWIDNGYKTMDASVAFEDYLGSDGSAPLSIDSMFGTTSLFDFDFGILYAPTENFRIGIHFQQPFIDFYWEFFEF